MDKPRDASRRAERFSTAKYKLFQSRGFDGSKKSKRKVRSLSAVGRAISSYENYRMGCDISGNKDSLPALSPSSNIIASTRLKFSYDCYSFDHVSVPRKLRSAMKKRNRESFLLDSEKASHTMNGIESPNGIKKSKKQGSTNWSPIPTVSGPITKDEEEVVETLYALSGMFPDNCSNNGRPLVGESLPENSSVLLMFQEGNKTAFEDLGTAACPSLLERSTVEATKTSFLSEIVDQELPEGANILMGSHNVASKMNKQNEPLLVGSENANKVELSLAMRLNKPRESLISHVERRPEMALEKDMGDECKQEQHMIKDRKKNEGPALWPGLSPEASAGSHASFLQSAAAAKHPDWVDAGICSSKQDLMENNSSGGKISEVVIHTSPWKRCAVHVYIGHLIQSLQVPNSEGTLMQQPNQSNHKLAQEGPKHEARMEVHDLKGMRNGIIYAPGTVHSDIMKNSHETKRILQRHYHHKTQAVPSPGAYGLQNQSFDFLSMSAGGSELEVNDSSKKVGRRLEPFPKLQVPYLYSLAQQPDELMSLPMLRSQYKSTSYLDHTSVVAPQQPQYYSCPSSGTHSNGKAPKKQELQGLDFWTVQVGARCRLTVNCNTTRTQYPNWQSRKQDSLAVSPCDQVIFPHSPAALEAVGSKITPISRQQQQLIALSSFPPYRTTGLHFLPPTLVGENRGSFHTTSGGTSLLCDEHI